VIWLSDNNGTVMTLFMLWRVRNCRRYYYYYYYTLTKLLYVEPD